MNEALQRRLEYGLIGEKSFEKFCKINQIFFKQFGFSNVDGYQMSKQVFFKVPKLMQCSPDYIMIKNKFHFVECKMADRSTGTHIKIKEHDLKYYKQWDSVSKKENGSLLFYIHNPMFKESYILKLYDIESIIHLNDCEQGMYAENGKYFYKIEMDNIRMMGREI